jgi:hypothetical protein
MALLVLATGFVAALSACTGPSPAPLSSKDAESIHVTGDVLINEEYGVNIDGECSGFHDDSDLEKATKVTIKDQDGQILATTRLEAGQRVSPNEECQLDFSATVPGGKDAYMIYVGHHDRREFSEEDMVAGPEIVFGG